MPVPTDITAGTLTITNGSTAVTGVDTSWLASDLRQGDIIIWIEGGDGFQVPILADVPASNTSLTLAEPWPGPTLIGVRYRIRNQWDSSRVSAQSRQLIERLDNGNILALAGLTGPGVPVFNGPHSMAIQPVSDFVQGVDVDARVETLAERSAYDGQTAGFAVYVNDVGDGRAAVYFKLTNTSGDWSTPAYQTGPVGATPTVTTGPVTTLPPDQPASVDPVVVPGGVRLDFSIPRGPSGNIDGVTPFWQDRITFDTDASVARMGLGLIGYGTAAWGDAEVVDANIVTAEGIRFVSSTSTNLPEAANGFLWASGARNDAYVRQTFRPTFVSGGFAALRANPRVWERVLVDSVWGDWALQYSDKNLVAFNGDAGSGGNTGLVPAPAAGDAAANKVLGAGGSWVTAASVPRGHLYNLTLSNNTTDATNDIDVSSGECASDDAQPALIRLSSALTKRLDAAWASGNGNGGRDTGGIANGWWHVFVIRNPTSSVVDVLFSASSTAPTLPSGYTQKRRIGSILRDSGSIVGFTQAGDNFTWKLPTNIYNVTDPGTSAILVTGRVPIGVIGIQAVLGVTIGNGTENTARSLLVTDPSTTDTTPTATLSTLRTPQIASATAAGQVTVGVSTAGQFRARVEVSGACSFIRISAFGWIDLRGRCL